MLGYPQVFPASLAEQGCTKLTIFDSPSEQSFLRSGATRLNATIASAAAANAGAEYVPVDERFSGHEICGNDGEWIDALSFSLTTKPNGLLKIKPVVRDQSFHPNPTGQLLGLSAAMNAVLNP